MDIKNVTDFFRKKGVTILQERTAFELITDDSTTVNRDEMDTVLAQLLEEDQKRPVNAEVEERVFRQAYIPQNLFEVVDPERDVGIVTEGGKDDLIYSKFLSVQETKSQNAEMSVGQEHEAEQGSSDDETESNGSNESSEEDPVRPRGKRHEDKDAKKVHALLGSLT